MGVRGILIKKVFFNPFVSCSRGPGPALDGSAARSQMFTLLCQRSGRQRTFNPWSTRARSKRGRPRVRRWEPSLRQYQLQRTFSGVDSLSLSPREESRVVISASSSRRQGAEARRVKRTRSGKRKSRDTQTRCDRVEAEAYLGSPSCHQSGLSSDDPLGEDEVENVRPGHVGALGAAYMSLESEGGAAGAAAFGTKRGRMPSAKIAIARLYGWSSSGGFEEATCLEAEPGRGQVRITENLVGGPHGGIVHFCATDAKVCKAGWPGRRVYHFDFWRPVTIAGAGGPAERS